MPASLDGDLERKSASMLSGRYSLLLTVTPNFSPSAFSLLRFVCFHRKLRKKSLNGDLVTYASYGFGEEWLYDNS
jgi:hypothetical protein